MITSATAPPTCSRRSTCSMLRSSPRASRAIATRNFSRFLTTSNRDVPADLEVHLIADNYATHKHPRVKAWLLRQPRFRFHYTTTYSSWLNQVERWFGLITQHSIGRGSLRSVRELIRKIDDYVTHYNSSKRPFICTATADSIFDKLQRLCKLINGTQQ
jgi:transposase